MAGDDIRWMTYQQLADALGIGGDSARNLVRRKRWTRQTGNDGLARIGVPVEHLEGHGGGGDSVPSDSSTDAPISPPIDTPSDGGIVPALEAHVESLQAEVQRLVAMAAEQRSDIEHERSRATGLADELAVIRSKLEAAESERDAERTRAAQVAVLEAVLDLERQRLTEARTEADRWREAATAPRGIWGWFRRTA